MKNKLAKLLALLLAAALLTACMAGCTGKTEQPAKAEATEKAEPAKDSTLADEEITLTFWHTYGDAEEAQFKDVVLPLWEKAHRRHLRGYESAALFLRRVLYGHNRGHVAGQRQCASE